MVLGLQVVVSTVCVLWRPSVVAWDHPSQVQRLAHSRLRFVTWFRASFMICTICAILAVDFPVFPRRFVKTETFGTSLMDTGVGFVVFSSGLVSKQARRVRAPFLRVLLSCAPVLVLGFVRLAAVRAVDYQTHVSEYGVHCKLLAAGASVWFQ